jgi:hypothetical protein
MTKVEYKCPHCEKEIVGIIIPGEIKFMNMSKEGYEALEENANEADSSSTEESR